MPPDEPVVPDRTGDERDAGWGDGPPEEDREDLDRFLTERPPHHGD